MDIHKNARLTPHSRAELVRRVVSQGQMPKAVATAFGVCPRTVRKWVERFEAEGLAGLADRSSRPRRGVSDRLCAAWFAVTLRKETDNANQARTPG
jgi:transposase-like protein